MTGVNVSMEILGWRVCTCWLCQQHAHMTHLWLYAAELEAKMLPLWGSNAQSSIESCHLTIHCGPGASYAMAGSLQPEICWCEV